MAFGERLGFGYLRLNAEWFPHTRRRLKRHILSFFMAYSELKYFFKDGVCVPSWIMVIRGLHNAKIQCRIGFLIPENL